MRSLPFGSLRSAPLLPDPESLYGAFASKWTKGRTTIRPVALAPHEAFSLSNYHKGPGFGRKISYKRLNCQINLEFPWDRGRRLIPPYTMAHGGTFRPARKITFLKV